MDDVKPRRLLGHRCTQRTIKWLERFGKKLEKRLSEGSLGVIAALCASILTLMK